MMVEKKVKRGKQVKEGGNLLAPAACGGLFSKQRPLSLFLPIPLLGAKAAGLGSLEPECREEATA